MLAQIRVNSPELDEELRKCIDAFVRDLSQSQNASGSVQLAFLALKLLKN